MVLEGGVLPDLTEIDRRGGGNGHGRRRCLKQAQQQSAAERRDDALGLAQRRADGFRLALAAARGVLRERELLDERGALEAWGRRWHIFSPAAQCGDGAIHWIGV